MTDIAMLSCNRSRITRLAISEIAKRTVSPYRLIVVDNGSTDGSDKMLEELFARGLIHKLVLLDENRGVHFGFNALLDLVESTPYYICTDSDLIPCVPMNGKDWLQRLITLMKSFPEYGAIACRPHVLIGEPSDRFDNSPEIRKMSHVGAHLRCHDVQLTREIGGWDRTNLKPSRNNEDWWIGKHIQDAGREVGYSRDVRAIHEFGRPDLDEDPWGYPSAMTAKEHGHVDRWPPVDRFSWDRMGVDWHTCEPEKA